MELRHNKINGAIHYPKSENNKNDVFVYPATSLPHNFFKGKPPKEITIMLGGSYWEFEFTLESISSSKLHQWEYTSKIYGNKLLIRYCSPPKEHRKRYLFHYDIHNGVGVFECRVTYQYIGNLDNNYKDLLDSYVRSINKNHFNIKISELPIGQHTSEEVYQIRQKGRVVIWPYDLTDYYNCMMSEL